MGTQQILMLVIGVIIVGIMILVGITMFNLHEYNSNKRTLVTEISTYPPWAVKFCTSSQLLGGAGDRDGNIDGALVTKDNLAKYIGFTGANYSTTSNIGEFRLTSVTQRSTVTENTYTIVIRGLGIATRNGKHPLVTSTTTIAQRHSDKKITDAQSVSVSDAAGW